MPLPTGWTGPIADQTWFDFDRVELPAFSTAGTLYYRSRWWGMPRIPTTILDSVFYLYHSREEAEAGASFGGTGFLIAVASGLENYNYVYGVTNWHVALKSGASVIRLNTLQGGVEIFEFDPTDWHFKPRGYDVAVVPIQGLDAKRHAITVLDHQMLVTPDSVDRLQIGPGDDVFMVGRFMDHDGGTTNVPAVRFGNISVMPQPVQQPNGSSEPSFILDVHSRTGYSGSPVFVYRTVASDLTRGRDLYLSPDAQFLQLLGIHWGQFPEKWEIESGARAAHIEASGGEVTVTGDPAYIKGLSGMTLAAPAWAILELLNMAKLRSMREQDTAIVKQRRASAALPPIAESAPPTTDENPRHKEDFTALVSAVARKHPRADQTLPGASRDGSGDRKTR